MGTGRCEKIGTVTSAAKALVDSQGLGGSAADCPSIFSRLRAPKNVAFSILCALLVLLFSACRGPQRTFGNTVPVTLPDGAVIHAELAATPQEQIRGLMFRRQLAPDGGMIFQFPENQARPFWMFQTVIPLDIIWINEQGVIVEISADTPPCGSTDPDECPNYGGTVASRYVLELAAGQAAAHQIRVGGRIRF